MDLGGCCLGKKIWDSLLPVELCGREGLAPPGGCVQFAWEGLLISVSRQGGETTTQEQVCSLQRERAGKPASL